MATVEEGHITKQGDKSHLDAAVSEIRENVCQKGMVSSDEMNQSESGHNYDLENVLYLENLPAFEEHNLEYENIHNINEKENDKNLNINCKELMVLDEMTSSPECKGYDDNMYNVDCRDKQNLKLEESILTNEVLTGKDHCPISVEILEKESHRICKMGHFEKSQVEVKGEKDGHVIGNVEEANACKELTSLDMLCLQNLLCHLEEFPFFADVWGAQP